MRRINFNDVDFERLADYLDSTVSAITKDGKSARECLSLSILGVGWLNAYTDHHFRLCGGMLQVLLNQESRRRLGFFCVKFEHFWIECGELELTIDLASRHNATIAQEANFPFNPWPFAAQTKERLARPFFVGRAIDALAGTVYEAASEPTTFAQDEAVAMHSLTQAFLRSTPPLENFKVHR